MRPNAVFSSPARTERWQLIGQPKSGDHALLLLMLFLERVIQASAMDCGKKLGGKYSKNTSHVIT